VPQIAEQTTVKARPTPHRIRSNRPPAQPHPQPPKETSSSMAERLKDNRPIWPQPLSVTASIDLRLPLLLL
jgi:hypothetical protein